LGHGDSGNEARVSFYGSEDLEEFGVTEHAVARANSLCPAKRKTLDYGEGALVFKSAFNILGHRPMRDSLNCHGNEEITKEDTRCTEAQIAEAVRNFAVPGSDGPKVSGRNYPVFLPLFGIKIGDVQFIERNKGMSFVNTTLGNHWLRFGSVQLNISNSLSGAYTVHVIGTGVNVSRFRAGSNQAAGPIIFRRQLEKVKNRLKDICGG
jgi:hypothetical protein